MRHTYHGDVFLRKRLNVYLLWATGLFTFLAVISSLLTDGDSSTGDTTTSSSSSSSSSTSTTLGQLRTYTVQTGDSLYNIAERFKLSAPALVEINKIKNPDRVPVGTQLLLPPSNGFVPIGATTTMPP